MRDIIPLLPLGTPPPSFSSRSLGTKRPGRGASLFLFLARGGRVTIEGCHSVARTYYMGPVRSSSAVSFSVCGALFYPTSCSGPVQSSFPRRCKNHLGASQGGRRRLSRRGARRYHFPCVEHYFIPQGSSRRRRRTASTRAWQ